MLPLKIALDSDPDSPLGFVEVLPDATLSQIRRMVSEEVEGAPGDYVFLSKGAPVSMKQEQKKTAEQFFPILFLRVLAEGPPVASEPPKLAVVHNNRVRTRSDDYSTVAPPSTFSIPVTVKEDTVSVAVARPMSKSIDKSEVVNALKSADSTEVPTNPAIAVNDSPQQQKSGAPWPAGAPSIPVAANLKPTPVASASPAAAPPAQAALAPKALPIVKLELPNGMAYEGEVKFGIPGGKGKLTLPNQDYYTGQFKDGVPHGNGVLTCQDGDVYEGTWVNGKREGPCHYKAANGSTYEGEFKDDKRHGKGKWISASKEEYVGDFVEDVKHGFGEWKSPDGHHYIGTWDEGRMAGEGAYTSPEGWQYVGNLMRNKSVGLGCFTVFKGPARGQLFTGEVMEWRANGRGVFKYADGSNLAGQFNNNKLHGFGTLKWPDGAISAGRWIDGQQDGVGIFKFPDGCTYEGSFYKAMRAGFGRMIYPDGNCDAGEWANDAFVNPEDVHSIRNAEQAKEEGPRVEAITEDAKVIAEKARKISEAIIKKYNVMLPIDTPPPPAEPPTQEVDGLKVE